MPVVDEEFQALVPPISDEEYRQLEENILAEGCREPIILWGDTVLDGHNRLSICEEHDLEYATAQVGASIADREAAKEWIEANQLGRRNLSPEQMSLLRGRIYNRRKRRQHDGGKGKPRSGAQSEPNLRTSEKVASELGVGRETIKRDGQFAEAADKVEKHVPDLREGIAKGEYKRADVVEAAKEPERAGEVLKERKAHVVHNSGNNEWYTPSQYVEAARRVLGGIDLDPASSDKANETVDAARFFTAEGDGLAQEWPVGRVWMNPPYAQPHVSRFCDRFAEEMRRGSTGIVLVNNATETAWFQSLARECSAICFPSSRITYIDEDGNPSGSPLQGQAFFYFGDDPEGFAGEFSAFGVVARVIATQGENT